MPIIEGPPEAGEARPPLTKRLIWFGVLWLGGLIAVAGVAYGLRALIL